MVQRHGNMMLVQNPPQRSLTQSEFDKAYELPYMKAYHPCYEKGGGVPGIKEVEFSITHNRGCFGYCNFCSIALHQGRRIQTRSEESVINEAIDLTKNRVQGIYPRCWRSYRKLPQDLLRQAGKGGTLQGQKVPCSRALPCTEGRSQRVS